VTLADRWPLESHHDVRDELLAAYGSPGRSYHDQRHLAEVLDRLADLGCDDQAVLLAAWFHDAVYDGAPDDEERSAAWAERALPSSIGPEVARLVRLTQSHRPADGDPAGQALCDADLAILASSRGRYAEYASDVRREYAHVSDEDFARGRAAVLNDLLAKPALFQTERGHELWEAAARANVTAELRRLTREPGERGESSES
jgi:predicted metal-dependent HD superfamily phosphohydrolase